MEEVSWLVLIKNALGKGASEAICISPGTLVPSVLLAGSSSLFPGYEEVSAGRVPAVQCPAYTLHWGPQECFSILK